MVFRSPKYYAELRKFRKKQELRKLRNKLDQVISSPDSREVVDSVHPGPGLKRQASSFKLQALKDTSDKLQAPSYKPQASSRKLQAPGLRSLEKVSRTFDQGPLPR